MKIRNKTCMFQKLVGIVFRPWRAGVVPDGTKIDLEKFEIMDEKKKIKKIINKEDK